ncbi:hypothetical protein P171DRAFT_489657 [Karstenula rhodostoma CBS 690.94]|uniref:Uncharacterized protein n=1 Tax=Karstenula rhodostoma CBS 690.94 TaxID=1392251 RepID=A0A9P4U8B3_9PLEO|nr:hypothetical protein P171DRAFT_489657 [Karstenula rhodostoma CBS 690.94]
MESPQMPLVLKTTDEFLKEVAHRYHLAQAGDQCLICHGTEGDDKTVRDNEKNLNHPEMELPCCRQLVHYRCLEKHMKGISKIRSNCVHCRAKLCVPDPLTPRQKWEEAAQEDMTDYIMEQPEADINGDLWMWTMMKVYDVAENMCHPDANPRGQDCFEAIDRITEGDGGFHHQHGPDAVLCVIHGQRGKDWLEKFVSVQMRKVLFEKAAITQNMEDFLQYACDSHYFMLDPDPTPPDSDDGSNDGNSRIGDQPFSPVQLPNVPNHEPIRNPRDLQHNRNRTWPVVKSPPSIAMPFILTVQLLKTKWVPPWLS